MAKCEYVGTIVITAENQTFTNTSDRTVGTCVEFSCYNDFFIVGPKTACCSNKSNPSVPKWEPGAASCKLNESANDLGLVESNIQLDEVTCYAVLGVLGGLAGIGLILFLMSLLCCFWASQKRKYMGHTEERTTNQQVIHEYGPTQTVHHTEVRHHNVSQPPSYHSKQPWPTGDHEYYREAYTQPNKREVADYDKMRAADEGRPNLWLTYADSLEGGGGHQGHRNRAYDYYDDDRDANIRQNYSRRW